MTTPENPHDPTSSTTPSEAPAPQAPSADETPSPKPNKESHIRIRALVNGQ